MDSIILMVLLFIFVMIMIIGKNYKIAMIILAFVFINGLCALLGFLFPTLPVDKIIPTQLWFNAVLFFLSLLPSTTAPFLLNL